MLRCREVATLSSDYLDRKLSTGQRLQFAVHLLMCGKCREFIRHMKLSIEMMRQKSEVALDDASAEAIARQAMKGRDPGN